MAMGEQWGTTFGSLIVEHYVEHCTPNAEQTVLGLGEQWHRVGRAGSIVGPPDASLSEADRTNMRWDFLWVSQRAPYVQWMTRPHATPKKRSIVGVDRTRSPSCC